MPRAVRKQKTKKIRGKGAYYPGGMTLRGKGGFFQDVGNFFKKAAGPVLGAVGGVANTIWPGSGMVTDGIRKLIGAGAYSPVRANAILAQPVPRVESSQDVGISYSHCEFLGDVTGSADWELTQFHVNPGLPEVFPWLSGVASNFQKYRIDGLVFYIRSTSSVAIANETNLGLGTVMGGFQNNVYDKAPGSKLEFLSLSGARSGKPSEDHIFPMECDRSKNVFGNLLIRTVGVADDLAKYDHAVFNLATVGFPGEYYLGELWVSYKLTLMAPKVESAVPTITTVPTSAGVERYTAGSYYSDVGAWIVPYPMSDASLIQNSAGWTMTTGPDGRPCFSVPAGTAGYFLIVEDVRFSANGANNPNELPEWTVLSNSGTATVDNTVWSGTACATYTTGSEEGHVLQTHVYKIDALPDRPMLLRESVPPSATLQYECNINLNITRLPDKIFAAAATSGTTVTLKQKVQRIQTMRKNALTRAQTSANGVVDTLERKENLLTPLPLCRQEAVAPNLTQGRQLTEPIPVRPAAPDQPTQASARYR